MSSDQLRAHLEFFGELGVEGVRRDANWSRRATPDPRVASELPEATEAAPPQIVQVFSSAADALAAIREDLGDCARCKLHRLGRRQIVFGVGNPDADLMFVGEGPGADEDIQGEPFVGRAGQLLTKIIAACGWQRSDVYILNVLKCRPPDNRNPLPPEVDNCRQYFERQFEILRPEYIVCAGTVPAQALLETAESVGKLRGRFHHYRGSTVLVTYHPSYLLRNPSAKKYVWDDMQMLLKEMGLPVPGRQ